MLFSINKRKENGKQSFNYLLCEPLPDKEWLNPPFENLEEGGGEIK